MKGGTLKQITNTPKAGLKDLPSLPDNEEFTVEIISKESGKKYIVSTDTLGSGEGGGGSSELFPNGYEEVNESRDFNSGDANKLLSIKSDDITLSMPSVNPFGKGDLVGIQNANDYKNTHIIMKEGNEPILIGEEVFIFDLVDIGGGIYVPQPLTGIIYDENEENTKSIIRYLYDKSQDAIPLSGTVSGSPVTGDIEIDGSATNFELFSLEEDSNVKSYLHFEKLSDHVSMGVIDLDDNKETSIKLDVSGILLTAPVSSEGITGSNDFTANAKLNPNSYVQYAGLGYRGTATLSSGTVTVTTDKIKTGYKIYLSIDTLSGTLGTIYASTADIVDVTSFVINSTSVLDNSTVNWWIAP